MQAPQTDSMLKQVMSDILVLQTPRASVSAMRAEAKRRAAALGNVSRAELATRLVKVIDEIRSEAITTGTAIEGEWKGD
ncbi:MAG: hypothetical protein HY740_04250 [Chloroflexi bacterium]|nr:hypothetical protein [Chloroflexota bacterium]